MDTNNGQRSTTGRVFIILAGYALALLAACLGPLMQYWFRDPDVAGHSSGMTAFGDLVWGMFVGGIFSLVPTVFLLRLLRGVQGFWRVLSWVGVPWVAAPYLAGAAFWLAGKLHQEGQGWGVALSAFLVVRGVACLPSLCGLVLAWFMCGAWPDLRSRLGRCVAADAVVVLAYGIWVFKALGASRW